jgi:putative lipase involved disintegration of autophagic bodies
MNELLNGYINRDVKVIVGYNPKDLSKVFVYDKEKKLICEAASIQLLNPLAPFGDRGVEENMRNQNRQKAQMRSVIKKMQMTYEERVNPEAKKPEKALVVPEIAEKQKVVGMAKVKAQADVSRDDKAEMSPFMVRMAKEAFEELELLGKVGN